MRTVSLRNPSRPFSFHHSCTGLSVIPRPFVADVRGYYRKLGLDPNCSLDDVRRRGRELAKQHHPDMGGEVEKFLEIQEILSTLLTPSARMAYDRLTPFDLFMTRSELEEIVRRARVAGDTRSVEEIFEDAGVRVVSVEEQNPESDSCQTPVGQYPSYYVEDGVAESEELFERLMEWHDMVLLAAIEVGWQRTIRVGIAVDEGFEIEWRWGEPVFWMGENSTPMKEFAGGLVATAML